MFPSPLGSYFFRFSFSNPSLSVTAKIGTFITVYHIFFCRRNLPKLIPYLRFSSLYLKPVYWRIEDIYLLRPLSQLIKTSFVLHKHKNRIRSRFHFSLHLLLIDIPICKIYTETLNWKTHQNFCCFRGYLINIFQIPVFTNFFCKYFTTNIDEQFWALSPGKLCEKKRYVDIVFFCVCFCCSCHCCCCYIILDNCLGLS